MVRRAEGEEDGAMRLRFCEIIPLELAIHCNAKNIILLITTIHVFLLLRYLLTCIYLS